jgi:acyl-CoA thioesterase-1
MSPNKQTILPCLARAAVLTALVASHSVALHTAAVAQVPAPAHFVAPQAVNDITQIAAPAVTPAAVPAVATTMVRPATSDVIKPVAMPAPTPVAATPPVKCSAPAAMTHLDRPLLHTMRYLASGAPLVVVAIGSSSTAGAGASSAAASYPNQLAADLRERFPGHDITVLNRGVNGEETDNMMARFAADVVAAHPQLIIWQVGTNSVLRDRSLQKHAALLHDGIAQLKALNADVVLMDLQYAPAVIAKSETDDMVEQIALAAKTENVDLFDRFAIMRNWSEVQHLSFDTFVAPDHLHMNDWGYSCVAKLLTAAIAEAATRPITSAAVHSH